MTGRVFISDNAFDGWDGNEGPAAYAECAECEASSDVFLGSSLAFVGGDAVNWIEEHTCDEET